MIDLIGTSSLGLITLIMAVSLYIKHFKQKSVSRLTLSNLFTITFVASVLRIIYLLGSSIVFNSLWLIIAPLSSLAIMLIGISFIHPSTEKTIYYFFLIIAVIISILSFALGSESRIFNIVTVPLSLIGIIIFSYLYFKFRTLNTFLYMLSLLVLSVGGYLSSFNSYMLYLSGTIGYTLMFLSFHVKSKIVKK